MQSFNDKGKLSLISVMIKILPNLAAIPILLIKFFS
jgi:hypothetical protein